MGYYQGIFLAEWDGPRSLRRVLVQLLPDEGEIHKIEGKRVYAKVKIVHGPSGWGGPVAVNPAPGRDLIVSLTGGGIHSCARHIADLSGATPLDGNASSAPLESIAVVVTDSQTSDKASFYARKGIPVASVAALKPADVALGAVAEELFVSGVRPRDVTRILEYEEERR